ncbi:hypothetical protein PtA15_15A342 [Puccinia triticina]|uniref:C2H2-type domain-containing protein n=1 Tax=Puccinia triticina TaxID=208348 RepID=A0ABY7D2V4_9BASI|nr:uncharacterized protein PtA15_15A342 [Puccinia triticina]WAQ91949.1 hypothetical protein PtA15_15A342 [Puccinia triticina]
MSDLAGLGEPRLRSPSPGRGGRFDDAGRRSPPPPADRWNGGNDRNGTGPPGSNLRSGSAEFGRKRPRDDSPPSRDRYIPNYEREPPRERERRDYHHPILDHDRPARHLPNPEIFDDPYRRGGSAYRDDMFPYSPDRGLPARGGPTHSRSHLTPPSELPYLVSFRYFADFMRSTSPHIADDKEKLAEQWKRYRLDHTRKQLVAFFEENRNKAWFREKYQPGPEFEELRQRLRKKGREGKVEGFISRLEKGDLDIINYDYLPTSTLNKKPVAATKSSPDQSDEPAAPTIKADPSPAAPTTLPPTTTQDGEAKESTLPPKPDSEVTAVSEAAKVKTESEADVKNEVNSTNPDADADEYEEPDDEFCASMAEAITGPNTGLAPSSALGSLIGESMRGKVGSDDIVVLPPADNQLFIKSISPDISRTELENHCKQVEGFDYLALSDPHTGKKLHRVGWVAFLPGTDMKAAESALGESKINNFTLHLMITERPALQKLRTCPGIMNTHERIIKDLGQIRKLAASFEAEQFGPGASEDKCGSTAIEARISKIKEEMGPNLDSSSKQPPSDAGDGTPTAPDAGLNPQDSDVKPDLPQEKNLTLDKKSLDLYIYYLRTVFNCCYYCVCVCDFQEELCRRCPKHVRKAAPRQQLEDHSSTATPQSHRRNTNAQNSTHLRSNEQNWARTLDDRVALILTPSEVDPREFGGERVDDEIHRLCQPQIIDEGAGKFRCKSCSKLFKAMNFIEKHIMSKHGEVINQDSIERIKYLNNYILDPSHTTPQAPPPPEYGHSRGHNGISAGPSAPHGMMASMGHGHPGDFHNGGYHAPMMNNSMGGPGGMMMGGPYGSYMPPMYPPYGPTHSYPPPMAGPSPMFPNGSMMGGHHGSGGGPGYGAPYYMGNMGPGAPYPSAFQPHHQVYSSLPAIPPPAHPIRAPNGNNRRLGERISRHFADEIGLPLPPHYHDHKRSRRDEFNRPPSAAFSPAAAAAAAAANPPPMALVASDPRSKTVLAYNDLDTPAGDEVVLNY